MRPIAAAKADWSVECGRFRPGLPSTEFIGVRDIRHGLAVSGKGHQIGGDAAQKGLKLIGFWVETTSSPLLVEPVAKIFFPSLLKTGGLHSIGPEVRLNRVPGWAPKKPAPLIESVDLGFGVYVSVAERPREKDEKSSIWGPAAATLSARRNANPGATGEGWNRWTLSPKGS